MPAPFYYWAPGEKCRQVETEAEANMVEITQAEYGEHHADFKQALADGLVEPTVRCWKHPSEGKFLCIDKPNIATFEPPEDPEDGET